MKYADGQEIKVGDRIRFPDGHTGIVGASMDTDQYSPQNPREQWSYLRRGIMVDTTFGGLVHYTDMSVDTFELVARGDAP